MTTVRAVLARLGLIRHRADTPRPSPTALSGGPGGFTLKTWAEEVNAIRKHVASVRERSGAIKRWDMDPLATATIDEICAELSKRVLAMNGAGILCISGDRHGNPKQTMGTSAFWGPQEYAHGLAAKMEHRLKTFEFVDGDEDDEDDDYEESWR